MFKIPVRENVMLEKAGCFWKLVVKLVRGEELEDISEYELAEGEGLSYLETLPRFVPLLLSRLCHYLVYDLKLRDYHIFIDYFICICLCHFYCFFLFIIFSFSLFDASYFSLSIFTLFRNLLFFLIFNVDLLNHNIKIFV